MKNLSPPSPHFNDEKVMNDESVRFGLCANSSLIWGRVFFFLILFCPRLSISVKTNEKFESPLPPFQWWKKKCVLVCAQTHHWYGGRVFFFLILFCPRLSISVKTNEKFESPLPPFQWWKKKVCVLVCAQTHHWYGGRVSFFLILFCPRLSISVKTNEKFESPLPPFQWWKKKVCVLVCAQTHHWYGGGFFFFSFYSVQDCQSRSKQMKNLSPPSSHFNDEKKSVFWFVRKLIIDMGGGFFFFSFYSVQDCQSRSKQMKNLSPPSPHFNDEKKKVCVLVCAQTHHWYGGRVSFFSFYSVQDCQSRSKQMKNLSPPSPHFNDEKKSVFWFVRKLIIDMGGGFFFFSFYSVQDCQSRSKQMKNLRPPSPHFNDEKKKRVLVCARTHHWYGGRRVLFHILFCPRL